jgi:hypothetical protein
MHPRLQVPDRVWLIFYAIDGRWQRDGEWYATRAAAEAQARANRRDMGWRTAIRRVEP